MTAARLALIAPALLAAVSAHAQEPTGTIVVTGRGLSDTPATPAYDVTQVDRETILAAPSGRIEDVLGGVAGFQQFRRSDSRSSNPSAQGVTLRALGGNATSRALVLLDGVPMADPFFGYIPLSAIAPERLGAIRVTRGGGSGAFGAGAVAGTIELESASAAQLGPVSGAALVNNRSESELSATLAPELAGGFAMLSGRWDRGQGFWTTPEAQRVPASARARHESWSVGLRGVIPVGRALELQAHGLLFDDRRTLRFEGADSSSRGGDASVRLVGRGAWQFDALAYVQARDFSNVVISATSFRKTLDQRRTPSTGLGGKLELRPPVGPAHVLRLGADVRHSDGGLQEEAYSAVTGVVTARRRAGGRNSDIGVYVEDDWTLGTLVLTAGLRGDRWSVREGYFRETDAIGRETIANLFPERAGWKLSWRGGAVWRATNALAVRGAAYSGLRLPTLNELYRPFVVFPVTTRANAALANERLRGFEAGIDVTPFSSVSLSLTAFDNRVEDAIANVTIGPNLRERRNIDAIRSRGVEVGADFRLGTVSLDGSLALTDASVQASGVSAALDGMRPAQTPRFTASATLGWHPRQGLVLAATVRHVGAQFEDDLESDVLPAATTLDAFGQVRLSERLSLVMRGENLTNTRTITRNQGGSIDLGVPRTVWAGLRVGL